MALVAVMLGVSDFGNRIAGVGCFASPVVEWCLAVCSTPPSPLPLHRHDDVSHSQTRVGNPGMGLGCPRMATFSAY